MVKEAASAQILSADAGCWINGAVATSSWNDSEQITLLDLY